VLVERHTPRLLRLCAKSTGEPARAEELVQDVWLTVWGHRTSYKPEGRFSSFLLTLALNRCRNAARGSLRARLAVSRPQPRPLASAAEPVETLLERERREHLLEALQKLSRLRREALLLRFDQGQSSEEIGSLLGCSAATVRSRILLGLRQLRKWLGERGDLP
jgi:RNA polymerase sigma-70 factor (ECF subfamily)